MKINSSFNYSKLKSQIIDNKQKIVKTVTEPLKKMPPKAKTSAIVAMFLLPTLGGIVVDKCSDDKNVDEIEIVDKPVDLSEQDKYLEKTEPTFYVVNRGDIPAKIAEKFGVSTIRLLAENNLTQSSLIHPGDRLVIPEAVKVKNVENLSDLSKATGLSKDFLKDLCEMEGVHKELYTDRNGHKTIGVGHLVKASEAKNYEGISLTDEEVYTLLAQDLIDRDLNLKTFISEDAYNSMPTHLKESILDLIFNKGEGAVRDNKNIIDGINEKDYVKVVSNLTQDYSVVTKANGEKVKKHASGLSKRRLYDIQNACNIFKNGIPTDVLRSAKQVYSRGLVYMEQEAERGELSKDVYENVREEYKALADEWFDGKLEKPIYNSKDNKTNSGEKASNVTNSSTLLGTRVYSNEYGAKKVFVKGAKTDWTVSSLYSDWEKTAKKNLRPFKRPLPEIDKNGNVTAEVQFINPKKGQKGELSGYTILINPGHGGAVANGTNVNFDPGASNAVMSKKNPNVETNVFIGNGGKALEEWIVNRRLAEKLVEKVTNAGGKVIFVQGSVYTAMDAIRKIQKENKVDLVISLHSNSDGNKRGIYVIGNERNGIDKEDKKLAQTVYKKMNEHSWFRGITDQTEQSLGVLSSSKTETSPVPGILIETGNLKHKTDVANLNSRDFKNQMIESIFDGMKDYLKNN